MSQRSSQEQMSWLSACYSSHRNTTRCVYRQTAAVILGSLLLRPDVKCAQQVSDCLPRCSTTTAMSSAKAAIDARQLKCSQTHEAVLFESISCIDNQIPCGSLSRINAIRGSRKCICVPALQAWSHRVSKPLRVWRKDSGMCIHILRYSLRKCSRLDNVLCVTYGSCLCSRCGRRAAPGRNCRVTCLNRGRSGCWNVAAVTGPGHRCAAARPGTRSGRHFGENFEDKTQTVCFIWVKKWCWQLVKKLVFSLFMSLKIL